MLSGFIHRQTALKQKALMTSLKVHQIVKTRGRRLNVLTVRPRLLIILGGNVEKTISTNYCARTHTHTHPPLRGSAFLFLLNHRKF